MRITSLSFFIMTFVLAASVVMAQTEPKEAETASADGRMTLMAPVAVDLGAPFLIRLTSLDSLEEATVHWLGREVLPAVSVWNEKHIVLAMLGTDVQVTSPGPSELVVVATAGGKRTEFSRAVSVREKIFPEEPDNPSAPLTEQEAQRMQLEAKAAAKTMNTGTPLRRWFLPFDRPVDAEIKGPYGSERFAYGRQTFRRGVDFAAQPGTPVKACGTGKVVLVADHLLAGKSVYIDHGNGVVSMYFHLLRADVIMGQAVSREDILGLSGGSGRGRDEKLHFAVAVQGRLVDPQPLFNNNAEGLLPQ